MKIETTALLLIAITNLLNSLKLISLEFKIKKITYYDDIIKFIVENKRMVNDREFNEDYLKRGDKNHG